LTGLIVAISGVDRIYRHYQVIWDNINHSRSSPYVVVHMPPDRLVPHFLKLSAINVLSNLMVPLAGLLDIAFLGHLAEIHHLTGVALATIVFNYLYWSFGFLRMSTTGLTAQAIGKNDPEAVLLIGLRNGLVAIILGGAIVLLQYPIRMVGFGLLSAAPEVKSAGQAYFNAMIWGAPATLLNYVLVGWFLGKSQSQVVFLLSIVSNLSNAVLNYYFIVKWGWASAGAGYATALSQGLMLGMGLLFVWRKMRGIVGRSHWARLWEVNAFRQLFGLNGAILIRTFALLSAFAIFTNASSSISKEALAFNTLLLQVVSIAAYFIDGFAYATESCAGILLGQGRQDQLRQLLKLSSSISFGVAILFAGLFNWFPDRLFGFITSHQTIVQQSLEYVLWLFPVLSFGSFAYNLDGYFLGLSAGQVLRNSSLIATLIGFLPIAIVGWHYQNLHILWLAMTTFMLTRAITLAMKI
jgi:multidrug resistance protein, MATE family